MCSRDDDSRDATSVELSQDDTPNNDVVWSNDEQLLKLRNRARIVARRAGALESEAEDVAQEALLSLIQSEDVRSPIAWVVTVAYRSTQQIIRTRMRRKRLAHRVEIESQPTQRADEPSDLLPDLARILDGLSKIEREVFLSHELRLCTMEELSVQTGLSVSTLKRKLDRTRRRFQQRRASAAHLG